MSLDGTHKVVTYLLVVLGLAPLLFSGEVATPVVVATYAAVAASWWSRVPRQRQAGRARAWTAATVVAFLGLGVMGFATGNWLLAAIYFSLVMVVTRLFQARGSREVFQLVGLTFITVIAGAVVNPSFSFLGMFLGYVVVLTWALVLLHLQRELEAIAEDREATGEGGGSAAWRARGIVTARFLAGVSLLALAVFAASAVFFFFFPRLGVGFFFGQGRRGQAVSGFSNRIELGHFGTIRDNLEVVLRVELPQEPLNGGRVLRMRGISFDHYDGHVWEKRTRRTFDLPQTGDGEWTALQGAAARSAHLARGEALVQDIYLEPLATGAGGRRYLFGQPRVWEVSIPNPMLDRLKRDRTELRRDISGDLSRAGRADTAFRYRVVSVPAGPPPVDLAAPRGLGADASTPQFIRDLYLQLPESLDPRIPALARELTRGAQGRAAKARALEVALRRRYRYSTEGGQDPRDPLADFLFGIKAGHCEFFATAMVVMLRTLGIPARPANGFYGGAYNRFGHFYAFRQADAHSWVEVFFPGHGWATYDPTPPAGALVGVGDGVLDTLRAWLDSLKLSWYKWVVEYDLEKQIAFFSGLLRSLREALPSGAGGGALGDGEDVDWGAWLKALLSRPSTWLWIALPVLALVALRRGWGPAIARWVAGQRARRGAGRRRGETEEVYLVLLRTLKREGFPRGAAETPSELAARVEAHGHPASAEVTALTRAFERSRYASETSGPSGRSRELRELLARVRASGRRR